MLKEGSGAIINIASLTGKMSFGPMPTGTHYNVSKSAIINLTQRLASELGSHGISVNAIAPGRIETTLAKLTSDEMNKAMIAGDLEASIRYYDKDVIVMPNFKPMIKGRRALMKDMKKDEKAGLKFHSYHSTITDIWQSGDLVHEMGTYSISLSTPEMPQPIADNGTYFSIWQKQLKGSYKVIFFMWNTDVDPWEK